ncbi:Uncharacterised protein [Klebsiella pneumoniae]|nr:Uncharacterised protein [Klebsiella pneumoniae]
MVDPSREYRPRHVPGKFGDRRTVFGRARIRDFQHFGAQLQRQPGAFVDQRRHAAFIRVFAFVGQSVGEELNHQQQVFTGEVLYTVAQNIKVMTVGIRAIGAQIDHNFTPVSAQFAHAAGADALHQARIAVAFRRGVKAGCVKADQQRGIAGNNAVINQIRHRADGVHQYARGLAGKIAGDIGFNAAQLLLGDRFLLFRVGAQEGTHGPALIAGDHQHRAVAATNLLIAAQFGSRHV